MMCPLCKSEKTGLFYSGNQRHYFRCSSCELIFLSQDCFLEPKDEKARYSTHRNSPDDIQYRNFLNRMIEPLIPFLRTRAVGLDYGCGPGPTVSVMLEEHDFVVFNYDPYFYPKKELLETTYDFVTCTEVVEHFYSPGKDFESLFLLIKEEGTLGIMTQLYDDSIDFESWYYKNDETHVSFYTRKTFQHLAKAYNRNVHFFEKSVMIFTK